MEVFTAATLVTLIAKVTSVLKYLTASEWREAATQAATWIAGIAVVWVASQASATQAFTIWGEITLGSLDIWSVILAGVALASGASVVYDFKKARDNTDSAAEPKLGGR
jgi:hypothetical protein